MSRLTAVAPPQRRVIVEEGGRVRVVAAVVGDRGPDGVSVSSATVNGTGHLIITLSNGTEVDTGYVVGPQGDQGDPGPQGVGVTGITINGSGHLIITLSNASQIDCGYVVGPQGDEGPQGVGVQSFTINGAGHLIVTLTTGTEVDAGYVVGPQGDEGPAGASVTASAINGSGHLIITLSTGATIDAGYVVGPEGPVGPGLVIKGTLPNVGALPGTGAPGDGYLIGGNLYVWVAGSSSWQDVGIIQGPPGDQGDPGPQGVSVTGASINGSGHLILTLSDSSTVDAGYVVGPQGDPGDPGPQGEPGTATMTKVPLVVAVDGQTTFNLTYHPGKLLVFRNGSSVGFTGTDGTTITLGSPAYTGDDVFAFVFDEFVLASHTHPIGDITGAMSAAYPDPIAASEEIADGDFVNLWVDAGLLKMRKADATVAGKEANGFVKAAVASTFTGTVYHSGVNDHVTGMTLGDVFLSTTAGKGQASPPSASGNTVQILGKAVSATAVLFNPNSPVVLA